MEQRNELLKQMKMTDRQKKGDIQHLLSRSFSRKSIPTFTPLSPTGGISIPVPQLATTPIRGGASKRSPSLPPMAEAEETVSIGELSVEPRVLGKETTGRGELIDLSTPQTHLEEDVALHFTDHTSQSSRGSTPLRRSTVPIANASAAAPLRTSPSPPEDYRDMKTPPRRQRNESDSSAESCPEEQSVRTPLLDGEAPATLPVNTKPSIKHYDAMFAEKVGDEEIPLGGTADSLINQP